MPTSRRAKLLSAAGSRRAPRAQAPTRPAPVVARRPAPAFGGKTLLELAAVDHERLRVTRRAVAGLVGDGVGCGRLGAAALLPRCRSGLGRPARRLVQHALRPALKSSAGSFRSCTSTSRSGEVARTSSAFAERLEGMPFSFDELERGETLLVHVDVPEAVFLDARTTRGSGSVGLPASYPLAADGSRIGWDRCQPIGQLVWATTDWQGISCRSAAAGLGPRDLEIASLRVRPAPYRRSRPGVRRVVRVTAPTV